MTNPNGYYVDVTGRYGERAGFARFARFLGGAFLCAGGAFRMRRSASSKGIGTRFGFAGVIRIGSATYHQPAALAAAVAV